MWHFILFSFCSSLHTTRTIICLKCMWNHCVSSLISFSVLPISFRININPWPWSLPVISISLSHLPKHQTVSHLGSLFFCLQCSSPDSSLSDSSLFFGFCLNGASSERLSLVVWRTICYLLSFYYVDYFQWHFLFIIKLSLFPPLICKFFEDEHFFYLCILPDSAPIYTRLFTFLIKIH